MKKVYYKEERGGGVYPKYGATTAHYPHCDVIMVIGTLLYLEANGNQQNRKRFYVC